VAAAYVNTVSRKVGVHSARASLDVSIIIMMGCEKITLRTCKSALAHLQMVIENAFYANVNKNNNTCARVKGGMSEKRV
jgi:ABC-type microcin C transport system permease subunit YejB